MAELEKTFTDSECIARYNSAADKSQMLTILAQCQQMSVGRMIHFLRSNGCKIPNTMTSQEAAEESQPRNPKRVFTEDELNYIRTAYEDGVPAKEMQKHLHCRNGKIMETISEMGLPMRKPHTRWGKDKDLALVHYYIRGDSIAEIARRLECSRYSVDQRVKYLREVGLLKNGVSVQQKS